MKFISQFGVAVAIALTLATPVSAQELNGNGSGLPTPLINEWTKSFKKETGIQVNYMAGGSYNGLRAVRDNTASFGITDAPRTTEELDEAGAMEFPIAVGGVVLIVNLKGLKPGELVLDGETLANIFLGHIEQWNDPAIQALNPSVKLPGTPIYVPTKGTPSSTLIYLSSYLSSVSREWRDINGVNGSYYSWNKKNKRLGGGGGSDAWVISEVGKNDGSIGFVEVSYFAYKSEKTSYVRLKNKAGKIVMPNRTSFQAAVASVDWTADRRSDESLVNSEADGAWPITNAIFALVRKNPQERPQSAEVTRFFNWILDRGGPIADASGILVALPPAAVEGIRAKFATGAHQQ